MTNPNPLTPLIEQVLDIYGSSFDFPLAGATNLPMKQEEVLFGSIPWHEIGNSHICLARRAISFECAYRLVTFGVRAAICGVRRNCQELLAIPAVSVVIDKDLVDWRDIIVAMSLIDDCAFRLGSDFDAMIHSRLEAATVGRRKTITEGWLSRVREERSPSVGGFAPRIGSKGLYYERAF